jgi:hypothetical protein
MNCYMIVLLEKKSDFRIVGTREIQYGYLPIGLVTAAEIDINPSKCSTGVRPKPHSAATPNSGATFCASAILAFVPCRSPAWTRPRYSSQPWSRRAGYRSLSGAR